MITSNHCLRLQNKATCFGAIIIRVLFANSFMLTVCSRVLSDFMKTICPEMEAREIRRTVTYTCMDARKGLRRRFELPHDQVGSATSTQNVTASTLQAVATHCGPEPQWKGVHCGEQGDHRREKEEHCREQGVHCE